MIRSLGWWMFGALQSRGWRAVVGLTSAYALVLQAFLAYSIATQAAAHGDSSYSGSFFVICAASDDGAAHDGAGVPVKPNTHCPICTLAAQSAAMLPEPVLPPVWRAATAERTPFVSAAACIFFHRARAGQSRAPPQNA